MTIEGNPVGNMNSYIKQSTGNAVSRPTGGGVISHAVEGAAYPVMGSFDVFIESSPALRVLDLWTANHMPGAKMPPNTPPAPLMGAMSVPAMAPQTATKDMSKEVLAQPKCLESVHRPYPEAGARERLPALLLVGATEVRQVEVYCEAKAKAGEESTHSCYLQPYFDTHSPQIDAAWTCERDKPYPGWEHTKDGLGLPYGKDCHENLYHASLLRHSPAGNTVHARVYLYVDGHPPAVSPAPAPQSAPPIGRPCPGPSDSFFFSCSQSRGPSCGASVRLSPMRRRSAT